MHTQLTHLHPFREMETFFDHYAHAMNRAFLRHEQRVATAAIAEWAPSADVSETDAAYEVRAELPGVESIPALVLQVGSIIQEAEDRAQASLGTSDIPANAERRIETEMTGGLLERLTESSNIWVSEPHWVDDLRPASEPGDVAS